ncbi:MAG TPA: penicillin-binding protein [Vicinamibacterales bacterium]|nr:penicillin-binding protein [Vicinamibacterales bacterium]
MIDRLRRLSWRQSNRRSASVGEPAPDWRSTLRRRILVASLLFGTWAVAVEARLVVLQVMEHDELVERAARQQVQTRVLAAKRGDIVDRKGRVLATSVDADTIYAVPSAIEDEAATVRQLCAAFGDCTARERQDLLERLRKQRHFAYVRRQVPQDVAARVTALNLDGIGFIKESHREYPNNELAAHVLGFVGIDSKGLNGVESAYDPQIRGKAGQVLVQADARHRAFNRFERPPTAGATVELTIDEFLQHIAERELRAGVLDNRAVGGTAIVMDPRTGEILALANEPTFDPNEYRDATEFARRNRAVQDLYEPGSTFKVVTASAAIEERIMPVDTLIDVSGGRMNIGARVIRDTHDYGTLSFTDVIVKSSNVGAIRIGFRLGTDRLSDYVQKFGFGRPVSPDFPSESPGIVWDRSKWTDSALASVSMGYQVGVTPLQMVTAVSSVANGGHYFEPRVLRAVYRDGRRVVVRPRAVRQTVSSDTAASMTAIMEQVVERGTGTLARIPGYTVAGKTGTANKLANGRYSSDTYASFVGFLPSNDPVVTILVVLDSPRGNNGHFGGPVSAPIFKRIAEETLRYLRVPPSINPDPPVLLPRQGGATANASNTIPIEPQLPMEPEEPGTVPDVRGLSARDAMRKLTRFGLSARMQGDGFVAEQSPAPGTPASEGTVCHLTLARAAVRQVPSAGTQ